MEYGDRISCRIDDLQQAVNKILCYTLMKGEDEFAATNEDIAHFVFNIEMERTSAISILEEALHDRQAIDFISSKQKVFLEYLLRHAYHSDDYEVDINNIDYEGGDGKDRYENAPEAGSDNDSDINEDGVDLNIGIGDDEYRCEDVPEHGSKRDDEYIDKILNLVRSDDRFVQTWQNLFVTQRKIKDKPSGVVSTVTSSRCKSIIEVKIDDAMRLKLSTWLNDTIIDAFALLISNQQNESLHTRIR